MNLIEEVLARSVIYFRRFGDKSLVYLPWAWEILGDIGENTRSRNGSDDNKKNTDFKAKFEKSTYF